MAPSGNRWLETVWRWPGWLVALAVLLAVAPCVWLADWASGRWAQAQERSVVDDARRQLLAREQWADSEIQGFLGSRRALPALMAQDLRLLRLLEQPGDPAARAAANDYLTQSAPLGRAENVWLLNSNGLCVAASNHHAADTLVGTNYADRDYVQQALRGFLGQQYAVGRRSNTPGLFHAAPVRDAQGRVLGVLAAKVDMEEVARRLDLRRGFIVDAWGLVVLASDPAWLGKALPDAALWTQSVAAREARYKRAQFAALPLREVVVGGHLGVHLGDSSTPALMRVLARGGEGFTLHLLQPLDGLGEIAAGRQRGFLLLLSGSLATVWLFVGTAVYVVRGRVHARQMRDKNEELGRLNELLTQQAQTDALTGCANRRRLHELLDVELQRLRRHPGRPLALAVLDIDLFKTVNDQHGHGVGDLALQHFAALMRKGVRSSDVLARVGGEEFVLMMLDTGLPAAQALLERLRASLPVCPLVLADGRLLTLTVSVGLSALLPGDDAADLLARADAALYAAKQGGRNRVNVQAAALAREQAGLSAAA